MIKTKKIILAGVICSLIILTGLQYSISRTNLQTEKSSLLITMDKTAYKAESEEDYTSQLSGVNGFQCATAEKEGPSINLSNGRLLLVFSEHPHGFSLDRIKDLETGFETINTIDILWSIVFRDPSGVFHPIDQDTYSGDTFYTIYNTDGGQILHLYWEDLGPDDQNKFDVEVTVQVKNDSKLSYWNISIDNRAENFLLWEVDFPGFQMAPLNGNPNDDTLLIPFPGGVLISDPVRDFGGWDVGPLGTSRRYPGEVGWQFATAYDPSGGGFYFATYDSMGYVKDYDVSVQGNDLLFYIHQYPEDMLTMKMDYSSPYPTILGTFQGDWFDASKLYKEWALKQPWASKGKLEGRDDVPVLFKETPLILFLFTDQRPISPNVIPLVAQYKQQVGLDSFIIDWLSWHNNEFDKDLPEYFPAREGFSEYVADLQKEGILVMPYINGRLWSPTTDSWISENAEDYAEKDEYNNIYTEYYAETVAVMDSYSQFWQDKVNGMAQKLQNDQGIDGIYLDQLTVTSTHLNFDADTGHSQGGGNYDYMGKHQLITKVRDSGRVNNPDFFVTSEQSCEPYIDCIDSYGDYPFEPLWSGDNSPVKELPPPVFQTIYHDYSRTVLSSFGEAAEAPIRRHFEHGLGYVHGNMLTLSENETWNGNLENAYINSLPGIDKTINYTNAMIESYAFAKKYLIYGEMLRPLDILEPRDVIGSTKGDYYVPPVLSSVWKANDKTIGIVLTNYKEEAENVSFNFNLEDYGLTDGNQYGIYLLNSNGETLLEIFDSDFTWAESLPPLSVRVLKISDITSSINAAIQKPQDRYLYIFDKGIMPLIGNPIIIGKLTVEVDACSENEIDRVEFYIDDVLKNTDTEFPYEWLWTERTFGTHEIKVIAYDKEGSNTSDEITVWRFL